jgi:hypothetical protein
MTKPQRVMIEFDDGLIKAIDFSRLSISTKQELSTIAPDDSQPGAFPESFLLLNWKDGWTEVLALNSRNIALLRYYIIERIEKVGRLSLTVDGTSYPELYVINRLPKDLEKVMIIDHESTKYYELNSEYEIFEGIFSAGGKKEYIKFDKIDSNFPHHFSELKTLSLELGRNLKREMDKRKLTLETISAASKEKRQLYLQELAKSLGLMGHRRQKDVIDFIGFLLKVMESETNATNSSDLKKEVMRTNRNME